MLSRLSFVLRSVVTVELMLLYSLQVELMPALLIVLATSIVRSVVRVHC